MKNMMSKDGAVCDSVKIKTTKHQKQQTYMEHIQNRTNLSIRFKTYLFLQKIRNVRTVYVYVIVSFPIAVRYGSI